MLILGIILLVGVCIAVKTSDSKIRKSSSAKAIVNISAIAGTLFLIVGFIESIAKLLNIF